MIRKARLALTRWINRRRLAGLARPGPGAGFGLVHPDTAAPSESEARFDEVWRGNMWASAESASGPGSERDSGAVRHAIDLLERLTDQLQLRSIADLPCGDFNWMPEFLARRPSVQYVGYDVVGAMIARNRLRFPGRTFRQLDITREVPRRADLIFSKDLLNHLTEADVWAALENMVASGARYLLLTTNRGFGNTDLQPDVPHASRYLDLEAAPYSLTNPIHADHYMLVFRNADVAHRLRRRRDEIS